MPERSGPRIRLRVAGMLFVSVAINYLDRSNLSVASLGLSRELGLDPVRLGLILSSFGWTYALFQIPGGWLVDRVSPRILYAAACGLWSLATLMQGFAHTFLVLVGLRMLLGLFEAPSFSICNRLATSWFPERERAGAIGFYTAGQFAGLAFLTWFLVHAQNHWGWRSVFMITGGVGVAWAAFWFAFYRDPSESRRLSDAERELIRKGGGWVEAGSGRKSLSFNAADLRVVLTKRSLWGIYLGQFSLNAIPWFFLTWFPTYLVTYRHIDFAKQSLFSTLPFAAAFAGVILGGIVSDALERRGAGTSVARKGPIVAGMLLSTSFVGANFVDDPRWIVFFLTLGFFGNAFASITWVMVSLIAPKRLIGLTGGVFNLCGNMASILVPFLIGVIVKYAGIAPAMVFVSLISLAGALSYMFLVGPVERVADRPDGP